MAIEITQIIGDISIVAGYAKIDRVVIEKSNNFVLLTMNIYESKYSSTLLYSASYSVDDIGTPEYTQEIFPLLSLDKNVIAKLYTICKTKEIDGVDFSKGKNV